MADERGDRRFKEKWGKFVSGPDQSRSPWQSFFTIITAPFRWILYFFTSTIGILLMLLILVAFFYGTLRAQETGVTQVILTNLGDKISKVPILAPVIDSLKTIQDPSRTIRTYSWQADIDKNSQNEELGLKFQKITSLKKTYLYSEPISVVSTVKVNSLKDNSKVTFSCDATTSKIKGEIQPNEPVFIPKDLTQVFSIRCDIPENSIKLDGKTVRAENIILKADYDFKTEAYVESYTMSKKILTEKQTNQEKIFENENNPRLNKDTGEVRSQYTSGPMRVLINSDYTQPFTEAGPFLNNPYYDLGIIIEKGNSAYQGKLNKINNVYLYLPKNFELMPEQTIFEQGDFVGDEKFSEEIFNKYKLSEKKIQEINGACKDSSLIDIQCQNYWERGFIIALTNFKINSLSKEDLDKNYIGAEVDYEFQSQISQVINVAESFTV